VANDNIPKPTRAEQPQRVGSSPDFDHQRRAARYLLDELDDLVAEVRAEREANRIDRRQDRFWQRTVAGLTLLVLVATLAILVKTYGVYNVISRAESSQTAIMTTQAGIMQGQKQIAESALPAIQEQAHAASTQASASVTNADAAVQSADTARQILQLTEAADVELESAECSTKAFGLDTRLTLHYRNFGRTRAVNLRQSFTPGILSSDSPPAPKFGLGRAAALAPNTSMPGETSPTVRGILGLAIDSQLIPDETPEAAFDRVRSGELRFGFWGRFRFEDVLNTVHESYFSYEWDPARPDQCVFTQINQSARTYKAK
jgi:Tfp pilus assembly protein PilV